MRRKQKKPNRHIVSTLILLLLFLSPLWLFWLSLLLTHIFPNLQGEGSGLQLLTFVAIGSIIMIGIATLISITMAVEVRQEQKFVSPTRKDFT